MVLKKKNDFPLEAFFLKMSESMSAADFFLDKLWMGTLFIIIALVITV